MQNSDRSLLDDQQAVQGLRSKKRCREDSETSNPIQKRPRQSKQSFNDGAESQSTVGKARNLSTGQLPSPALTGSGQEPADPASTVISATRKRKAKSLDWYQPRKRTRPLSEPVYAPSPINQWLAQLPQSDEYDPLDKPQIIDDMSQPPSKRSRSQSRDSFCGRLSQSGDGSDTTVSRDKKYSVYKDANYPAVLETKGSFMGPSELGMVDEDCRLCEKLFTNIQAVPDDISFNDDHFAAFRTNLRGRSEARICADLHPRIMPSVENLCIYGRKEFSGLIEGHNDPWIKSIPFCGPRPQPDHTFGFKWFNFNEQQRRKLNIEPTRKSLYTAREDIYFPFLTGEVKCGKQGLDLADRPNAHSMTIALRGIVDLYRRLNRPKDVHRRLLGFSISHDDRGARLYTHYPVIDGENTTYWRHELPEINFGKGEEKWQCYRFTLNVCELFALPFLERLKSVIDELPDPATQSFGLTTTLEDISVQSSQDDTSATEDEGFKRPAPVRGLNAELRNMIQGLQRQLEQQRQDSERQLEQQRQDAERHRQDAERQRQDAERKLEQQRKDAGQQLEQQRQQQREDVERQLEQQRQQQREDVERQLEQQRQLQRQDTERQRQDAKEREALLITQLEQQRKELEQLMDMLKQQSAQINQLLQRGG